jgi:hypothetical protein
LITQEMRQQVLEAKNRLENYVKALSKFFEDVHNLDSPNTALELAEDLQCRKPLETTDAGKGVVGARAEDDLGGL